MINVKVAALFFILSACVRSGLSSAATKGFSHHASNQILATIDAVFITLKINENFTKPKNIADYLSMLNFLQDAVRKNDQVYQRIRSKCKTKIGNKTTSFNSKYSNIDIDAVIEETINNLKAKITKDLRDNNGRNTTAGTNDELRNGFLKLINDFHLEINTIIPNDIKLLEFDVDRVSPGSRRIFMGNPTTIARYPFMASIHVRGQFTCAGALIHNDMVITAASCFIQYITTSALVRVKHIKVRVGSDFADKNGELLPIAGLYMHPSFNNTVLSHNLAIVHLEKQLKMKKNEPASVKFDRTPQKMPIDVTEVVILGWGEKCQPGRTFKAKNLEEIDETLAFARLELYDLDECEAIYTRTYITEKLFCAGFVYRGSGACKSDVGAPAIVGSTLTGVTNFGAPTCGQRDAPTVFTKLGFYADWIDSVYSKIHKVDTNSDVVYDFSLESEDERDDDVNEQDLITKLNIKYLEDFGLNEINLPKTTEANRSKLRKTNATKKFSPKKAPVSDNPSTSADYEQFAFEFTSSTKAVTRKNQIRTNKNTNFEEWGIYSSEEKIKKEKPPLSEGQILKYYRKGGTGMAEVDVKESGTTRRYMLDIRIPGVRKELDHFKKIFRHYNRF